MNPIYQNDQYFIRVRPKINGNVIDDTSCDELIIKLGKVVKKKSLNEITYNAEEQCWLFPLSIDQSCNSRSELKIQAWIKFDDTYYATPVESIKVNNSIILKDEVIND